MQLIIRFFEIYSLTALIVCIDHLENDKALKGKKKVN